MRKEQQHAALKAVGFDWRAKERDSHNRGNVERTDGKEEENRLCRLLYSLWRPRNRSNEEKVPWLCLQ
jgi:hypothetical protein